MKDRDVQRLLTVAGYYSAGIDGDFGPKSWAAVEKILERNHAAALKWAAQRKKVAAAQIILNAGGYEPGPADGYAGHNTLEAFNAWDHVQTTGKAELFPGRAASFEKASKDWPAQSQVRSFFGEPGGRDCTAGKAQLPFSFQIAWNTSQKIQSFSCHKKVAEPLTTIFREAVQHYGERAFSQMGLNLFGGCYNFRKMRGGSAYSMHSWGIAVDLDPSRNQLRWGRDRAAFARPDYNAWWAIVEAQGGVSLGREKNFDWMHFQFATV